MKFFVVILLVFLMAGTDLAQRPGRGQRRPAKVRAAADPANEKPRYEAAIAAATNEEKAKLLQAFVKDYPRSEMLPDALAHLTTARALVGNERLAAGQTAAAIESFSLAITEAPDPTPDRLYDDIVSKIPTGVFYQGERQAAMELAKLLEKKYAQDAKRLLGVASFYLSIENPTEARRVIANSLAIDPSSTQANLAMAMAARLDFDLEGAARSYEKALELDPTSVPAKRGRADMKRALGAPAEALELYREIYTADPKDVNARSGMILSMFGTGERAAAEAELASALEAAPGNFALLAGAAYWYAAHNAADKAVEYGEKAVAAEPRYIWGHIALAKGLVAQGKPLDAERVLVAARRYGDFPTLEYELAEARLKAGFYREAAEGLARKFRLREGSVETQLGGRVTRTDPSIADLIAAERLASILESASADDTAAASRLKALMALTDAVENGADAAAINAAADAFAGGDDVMNAYRRLYAAELLLGKTASAAKAAELVSSVVGTSDAALDAPAAKAAVMASQLYDARAAAFQKGDALLVPDVPRQTLSGIMRGRIEELAGWSALQQQDAKTAETRLRRAVSVLPDKSAWWRSAMWRLGSALEAEGNDKEALDAYIKSYRTDRPSGVRYALITTVYRRLHGSTEGLEALAGPDPLKADGTLASITEPAKPAADAPSRPSAALPVPMIPSRVPVAPDDPVETRRPEDSVKPAESELPAEKPAVEKADEAKPTPAKPDEPKIEEPTPEPAKPEDPKPVVAKPEESKPEVPKAEEPKPELPKPAQPKSEEAKPEESKPTEPKPEAPKGEEPKPELPKPAEPKAEEAKPEESKPTEPKPEAPKGEVTKREDPKPVVPAAEEPKAEDLKPVLPKPEESKAEEPTTEEPKPDEIKPPLPKAEEPKPEEPKAKPLFEPVVIVVGSTKAAEAAAIPSDPLSSERSRLPAAAVPDGACSVEPSRGSLTLERMGPSELMAVSIVGGTGEIIAKSSSAGDVAVSVEIPRAPRPGTRYFRLRSVSDKPGDHFVEFKAECGVTRVTVRVD